jgi:uncharacterized membrane protein
LVTKLTLQTNKTLGILAAIFTLFGAISTVISFVQLTTPTAADSLGYLLFTGFIGTIAFLGFILYLVAMWGFSKDYNEPRIFSYILYGIIITFVAAVIAVIVIFVFTLTNLVNIIIQNPSPNPSDISAPFLRSVLPFAGLFGFIGIIYVVLNYKALNLLGEKSKVSMFKTSAKLFLGGAIVNLLLGIIAAVIIAFTTGSIETFTLSTIPGSLVQYSAWAILAVACLRINTPSAISCQAPSNEQVKYCQHCGNPNPLDSKYCIKCGKPIVE